MKKVVYEGKAVVLWRPGYFRFKARTEKDRRLLEKIASEGYETMEGGCDGVVCWDAPLWIKTTEQRFEECLVWLLGHPHEVPIGIEEVEDSISPEEVFKRYEWLNQ